MTFMNRYHNEEVTVSPNLKSAVTTAATYAMEPYERFLKVNTDGVCAVTLPSLNDVTLGSEIKIVGAQAATGGTVTISPANSDANIAFGSLAPGADTAEIQMHADDDYVMLKNTGDCWTVVDGVIPYAVEAVTTQIVTATANGVINRYTRSAKVTGAAAVTVTLPLIADMTPGAVLTVYATNGNTHNVTVNKHASDTGAILSSAGTDPTTYTVAIADGFVTLLCTGDRWVELTADIA